MICREILTKPEIIKNFDFFNDYNDTRAYLVAVKATQELIDEFDVAYNTWRIESKKQWLAPNPKYYKGGSDTAIQLEQNFLPVKFRDIRTKTEIESTVDGWLETKELSPLEKYLLIKEAEYVVKYAVEKLGSLSKEDFFSLFGGVTSLDIMGVKMQLADVSKAKKYKEYEFSSGVADMESELAEMEQKVKDMKEILKAQKNMEINQNIAKPLDNMFKQDDNAMDDWQLRVSLRK